MYGMIYQIGKGLVILSMAFCAISACSTVRQQSRQTYIRQIEEIERSYQKQEITKAEYLTLKLAAENAFHQREATLAAETIVIPRR
jgi:hypothetical protein